MTDSAVSSSSFIFLSKAVTAPQETKTGMKIPHASERGIRNQAEKTAPAQHPAKAATVETNTVRPIPGSSFPYAASVFRSADPILLPNGEPASPRDASTLPRRDSSGSSIFSRSFFTDAGDSPKIRQIPANDIVKLNRDSIFSGIGFPP